MDVYKVTPASYSAPEAHDPEEFVRKVGVGAFTGSPMLAHWPEPRLTSADPGLLSSDFFYFGLGGLAFPPRTLEVFKDLFDRVGEVLPFTINGAPFFALNVLRRVDALDTTTSEVLRLGNGKIVKVLRYEFRPALVAHEAVFRIPEQLSAEIHKRTVEGSKDDAQTRASQPLRSA